MTESESIGTNHLEFVKFLFQHYCQHLGLNYNQILAESAFNFYVNKKIVYLLRTPVNIESARKTFYHKLIQNTSLPTNYNFTSIITEINKEIEHHIQQRYPITYANKGKGKLQTLAKHRIELPTNPLYHYTPGSAINITSTGMFTLNKKDLLRPYGAYFKEFKSRSPTPSGQPIAPIALAPIAKLEKFTGKEDDAQTWINNVTKAITANN
ncbi:hypothetical protein G9A89_019498 [Geosiphon pyriformis]|nr:hypothetical protein G9A89_019498 [Geosiphon pyriformis]